MSTSSKTAMHNTPRSQSPLSGAPTASLWSRIIANSREHNLDSDCSLAAPALHGWAEVYSAVWVKYWMYPSLRLSYTFMSPASQARGESYDHWRWTSTKSPQADQRARCTQSLQYALSEHCDSHSKYTSSTGRSVRTLLSRMVFPALSLVVDLSRTSNW